MVLEGANDTHCLIVVMHVWGNELEGGFLLESDGLLVSRTGFVIEDLENNGETFGC
jgi:hypothetical protein